MRLTLRELLEFLELTRVEDLCLFLYPVMLDHPLLQLLSSRETRDLRGGRPNRIETDENLDGWELFEKLK